MRQVSHRCDVNAVQTEIVHLKTTDLHRQEHIRLLSEADHASRTIPSCGPYEGIRLISLFSQLLNSAHLTVQIESSCDQDFYYIFLQISCSWTYWNPTYGCEVDNLNWKGTMSWVETNFEWVVSSAFNVNKISIGVQCKSFTTCHIR